MNADVRTESAAQEQAHAHVIVVGNEKGGCGKTTTCMHVIVALLRLGFRVGSIDTDARQRTLSRYIENRRQTVARKGANVPLPHHVVVNRSPFAILDEAQADERERFAQGMAKVLFTNDFVVIDSPGSDTFLSRLAHSFADTVITPINDSFVDLDVLAHVDPETCRIVRPSIYSEMLWEQKLQRMKRDNGTIDWIVMRNRLSNIDARNKRLMSQVMDELARRVGFRTATGFSERVIFRDLFLQGLTVLDVLEEAAGIAVTMSHIGARQEVRELLKALRLPQVEARMEDLRTQRDAAQPAETTEPPAAAATADEPISVESTPMESTPVEPTPAEAAPATAAHGSGAGAARAQSTVFSTFPATAAPSPVTTPAVAPQGAPAATVTHNLTTGVMPILSQTAPAPVPVEQAVERTVEPSVEQNITAHGAAAPAPVSGVTTAEGTETEHGTPSERPEAVEQDATHDTARAPVYAASSVLH